MYTELLRVTRPGFRHGNRCGSQNSRAVRTGVCQLREGEVPMHDTGGRCLRKVRRFFESYAYARSNLMCFGASSSRALIEPGDLQRPIVHLVAPALHRGSAG